MTITTGRPNNATEVLDAFRAIFPHALREEADAIIRDAEALRPAVLELAARAGRVLGEDARLRTTVEEAIGALAETRGQEIELADGAGVILSLVSGVGPMLEALIALVEPIDAVR